MPSFDDHLAEYLYDLDLQSAEMAPDEPVEDESRHFKLVGPF